MSNLEVKKGKSDKTFFQSVPGIITSLAALITAIGGCIAVVFGIPAISNAVFGTTPTAEAKSATITPSVTQLDAYIILYKDDTFSGASLRIDLDDCGRVDIKRDSALYDSTSSFILVAPNNVEIVLVQNLTSDGYTGNTGSWQGNNESLQVNIDELKDLGVHDNVSSIQWLVDGKLLNDRICPPVK